MKPLALIITLFRFVRPVLFTLLLLASAWQAVAIVRGPSAQAAGHTFVGLLTLTLAVRLYVAKRSIVNRAINTAGNGGQ
ncbi:hypothetical protein [Paraburkholderia tropica]|uniref:hypothetical protein n=1 Tax=Paraburkholderia tropica TaxID=92647 RepID=UPI0031DE43E9